MTLEQRQKIEKQVARKLLRIALAAGYAISLDNGGDEFEFKDSTTLCFGSVRSSYTLVPSTFFRESRK